MQKWKCKKCGFIFIGNAAPQPCIKCSVEGSYSRFESEQKGTAPKGILSDISWKCRVCGYTYESDLMMELCPFCKSECPFVDNSNYLPPEDQPQKPFTDKSL